jgi:hypothetical protein
MWLGCCANTVRPSGSSTTQAADLANFLPHSKLCSVIFTTTESNTAKALAPQNITALHELTLDTALRMLQNRLTTPLLNAEQQEAMHLLRELSYLPLAVAQAAAHINNSSMTVQQYQAQLDQHKEAALKYGDDSSEGELREFNLRKTVAATLSLFMSQTRHSNAVAVDYLFVAACVDRKDISLRHPAKPTPRLCLCAGLPRAGEIECFDIIRYTWYQSPALSIHLNTPSHRCPLSSLSSFIVVLFHRCPPTIGNLVLLNGIVVDVIPRRYSTIHLLVTLLRLGGLSNRVSLSLI